MVGVARGVVVVMREGVDLRPLVPVEAKGGGWEEPVVFLVDVFAQRDVEVVHERVVTGDDGVELNMLGTTNADKLETNTTGFGGYVNPETGDVGVGVAVALMVAAGAGVLVIKKKKD